MIYDDLTNWNLYFKEPIFEEIYQKLLMLSVDSKNGEHFRTDSYYFKMISYDTLENPTVIESHKNEVDVQVVLSGGEKIKIYSPEKLEISSPYSEQLDCQFYKATCKPDMELNLIPGRMAVFFPQDAHACQYTHRNEPETIKKIVIKINEELFTHQK